MDPTGKFHMVPWDANETFREPESMARRGGVEIAEGAALDPFTGASDPGAFGIDVTITLRSAT